MTLQNVVLFTTTLLAILGTVGAGTMACSAAASGACSRAWRDK
jgi:hypothetical protein